MRATFLLVTAPAVPTFAVRIPPLFFILVVSSFLVSVFILICIFSRPPLNNKTGVPNGDGTSCIGNNNEEPTPYPSYLPSEAPSSLPTYAPSMDPMDVLDACGVVGGDGTSCLDACNVPFGDSTSCADICGV
jgi:hypothetical protein